MRKTLVLLALALSLLANLALAAEPAPPSDEEARQAAKTWLALIDGGKYPESWKEAATLFKAAVPEQKWAEALGMARPPLGKFITRKLISSTYYTALPGAPEGQYYVLIYDAAFQHRQGVNETVTPMKDADGVWRVSGYYIK